MATVHHAPDHLTLRRNWRTLWIVLTLIVAVAIVYRVASVVSQTGPSDTALVPADQPSTGGTTRDGEVIDVPPVKTAPSAPSDDTPLTGRTVTDGAGAGTVTDATTGATDNGAARGTNGNTPIDQ